MGVAVLVGLGCGAEKAARPDNKAAPVTDEQAPPAADWAEQATPCPGGTTLERAIPDDSAGAGMPGEPAPEQVWCQDAAGIKHGPFQLRTSLGQERGRYRHGNKHGPWQVFTGAELTAQTVYVDGLEHGEATRWVGGERTEHGRYERGDKVGPWLESTPTDDGGFLRSQGQYVGGRRHGQWTSRYPDGRTAVEQHFDHGTPVGRHVEWYPSGQKSMEFTYDDAGVGTIWHDNGHKWFEVPTVRGKPDGRGTRWDARGKVQRIEDYAAGALVKATDMRTGVRLVYEIANLKPDEPAGEWLPTFIEALRDRLPQPSTGLSLFIKGDTIVLEAEDVAEDASARARTGGDGDGVGGGGAKPGDDRARRIERAFAEPFPALAIRVVDGSPAGGRPALAGSDVADAAVSWDPETNRPVVIIEFTEPATRRLAALTRAHVGKRMTLAVGHEVILDAVIHSAIDGGQVMVTMAGDNPQQMGAEARALADKIRLGASDKALRLRERSALGGPLPVPATPTTTTTPVFPHP